MRKGPPLRQLRKKEDRMSIIESLEQAGASIVCEVCPDAVSAARARLKSFPALCRSYPKLEGIYRALATCVIRQMRKVLSGLAQNPDFPPFIAAYLKEQPIRSAHEKDFLEQLAIRLYGVEAFDGVIKWREDTLITAINEQMRSL